MKYKYFSATMAAIVAGQRNGVLCHGLEIVCFHKVLNLEFKRLKPTIVFTIKMSLRHTYRSALNAEDGPNSFMHCTK